MFPDHGSVLEVSFKSNSISQNRLIRWGLHSLIYIVNWPYF